MKSFSYIQNNTKFSINATLQNMDILIQCIISDKIKYSSVFNFEKLKNIDILFGGFSPLQLKEIYDILCIYFEDNKVTIKQACNSKVIIEIEKDFKPNMIFEIERDKINSINDNQKNIRLNNNMNNQIMDIYNNNENLMINSNNSNNITNMMINKIINTNNNNIILNKNNYNDNMNNNGNMNNNNINNIDNMNNSQSSQKSSKYLNYIDNNYYNYNANMPNNVAFNGNMNNNKYNNCNQITNLYNNNNFNNNYNHNNENMKYYPNNINNIYNNNIYNYNFMGNINNNNFKDQEHMENYGGSNNKNFNDNNLSNNNIFHNLIENIINYNKNKDNHLNKKQNEINSSLNVRVAQPKKNQKGQTIDLSCFLKFFLIKKLTNIIENISKYESLKNVEEVIKLIKNNQDFKEDINSKNKINILSYLKYLDDNNLDKNFLLENLFTEKKKLKDNILDYWKFLSTYEEYNSGFEHQFFEDLKKCNLEYSLVNMIILERDNPEEYEQKKNECKNMKKMKVYLLSEIYCDSNNLNIQLEYSNKSTFGRGFYFSDSIEYVLRYHNDDVPKIGEYFSLMICEIFYDEEKLKEFDKNTSQNSSSEDKEKVEPNGLKKIEIFHLNNNNNKIIISNEYVLSEKFQIFPLYIFTLRRNEYYVLNRNPDFVGKDFYSKKIKLRSLKYSNDKNFYFESSTEEALQLVLKKKNVKVILITNYGDDESGMRFAKIAKKILQKKEEIVLFLEKNIKYLESIANTYNCLYTQNLDFYEEYISNYNKDGLNNLKEKLVKTYPIQLKKFFLNFVNYSNYDVDLKFSDFDDNNDCIYFRSVYILNPDKSLYLAMTKERKIIKSKKECLWKITVKKNNITLFSNGFYLNIDKNKEIALGSKEMKIWNFEKDDNDYYFYNEEGKNDYLSMEDEDIKINKKALINNSKFNLIDVYN